MAKSDIETKIENFYSQFQTRIYKKGELIIQPDDNPIGAYYLKKGHVREYGMSLQGREITLHIFAPHSYFPMMWVLADISNRYYYEALTDVEVYSVPKDKVLTFLKNNPDVLYDLTRRAFIGLDKLTSRIEHLAYGKAYHKVISILLYLTRHFGEKNNDKIDIKHKFTHRDIGSLAGVSRETASRAWEMLQSKGLVQYYRKTIVINDVEKLEEFLLK